MIGEEPVSIQTENIQLQRLKDRGLTMISPTSLSNRSGKEYPENEILEFILAEPYSTISMYFIDNKYKEIVPVDSESELFLPRIPILHHSEISGITDLIKDTGAILSSDRCILTGNKDSNISPFVILSIACFSIFVKFFLTILNKRREGELTLQDLDYIDRIRSYDHKYVPSTKIDQPIRGTNAKLMIGSAGRSLVSRKLVDSIFGNISVREGEYLYISTSGSYLDDLENHIVKIPLNGSVECEPAPSSETEVHRNIYKTIDGNTIIHGHPLFTVILSLDCKFPDCSSINNIPVVPSASTGPMGKPEVSVPDAIRNNGCVIVRGHGIFCSGNNNFDNSLKNMIDIENYCREEYFRRLL